MVPDAGPYLTVYVVGNQIMSDAVDAVQTDVDPKPKREGGWLDIFLMLVLAVAALLAMYKFAMSLPRELQPLTLIAGTAGALLGWGAGILAVPYRQSIFSSGNGRLLIGLVVGFALAWFWRDAAKFLTLCGNSLAAFFSSGLFPLAAVGVIAFLFFFIATFMLRRLSLSRA